MFSPNQHLSSLVVQINLVAVILFDMLCALDTKRSRSAIGRSLNLGKGNNEGAIQTNMTSRQQQVLLNKYLPHNATIRGKSELEGGGKRGLAM